jgi:hypothetical protein
MPAVVAPEGFQAHESFIPGASPELARTLESALILAAGRFDGPAADRFAGPSRGSVVHSVPMVFQISQLGFGGLAFLSAQSFGQPA